MKNKRFNVAAIKNPLVRRITATLLFPLFFVALVLIAVGAMVWDMMVAAKDAVVDHMGGLFSFCTLNVYIAWVGQDKWDSRKEDARKERIARLTHRRA